MDRFELVEKLVKSTGVSFEDAKTALESNNWDLLEAAVWLEKNGRIESKTSHFSTNPEQQQEQEEQRKKQEEQERNEQQSYEPRGQTSADRRGSGDTVRGIFSKIRGILMDNELVICKPGGEIFLEFPIWLVAILMVVSLWATLGVLILIIFFGFRIRFHGPDLGGERVNRTLNNIQSILGKLMKKLKDMFTGKDSNHYDGTHGSAEPPKDDVIDYQDPKREE